MKVTKGYLEETRELVVSLVEIAAEIRQLQEQAVSTPGQLFSDVRVQTTNKTDAMADRVVKYADLEELYINLHRQYLDRFEAVTDAIKTIPVREQIITIRYYLRGETCPEICDALYISRSTFYNRLRSALTHIAEID